MSAELLAAIPRTRESLVMFLSGLEDSCRNAIQNANISLSVPGADSLSRAEDLVFKSGMQFILNRVDSITKEVNARLDIKPDAVYQIFAATSAGDYDLAMSVISQSMDYTEFERKLAEIHQPASPRYRKILDSVLSDGALWEKMQVGVVRPGHTEGSIEAHVAELERNLLAVVECLELGACGPMITSEQFDALVILIHCHDTFKGEAKPGVSIIDPESHASLARGYLATHNSDSSLLNMTQLHDEPFAIFNKWKASGIVPNDRLDKLFHAEMDWDTFLLFQIIDNTTIGKTNVQVQSPTAWFIEKATATGLAVRDYLVIEKFVEDRLHGTRS